MSYRPPARPPFPRGGFNRPPPVAPSTHKPAPYGGPGGQFRPSSSDGPRGGYSAPSVGGGKGGPLSNREYDRDYQRDRSQYASSQHNGGGYGGDPRDNSRQVAGRERSWGKKGDPSQIRNTSGRNFDLPKQTRAAPSEEVRLDRLARERTSRTLFIRNIAYETNSDEFRTQFESYGEVKEFFDSIRRRGLVFVTFYDLRASEAARRGMTGTKVFHRPIDVHYGLPKDHDREGPCDRTKNQGSIRCSLRSRRPIDERDLQRIAEVSGAVQGMRPGDFEDQRVVEFYDSRAAIDFYDRLNGSTFMGSTLDMEFVWDQGKPINTQEQQGTADSRYPGHESYGHSRYTGPGNHEKAHTDERGYASPEQHFRRSYDASSDRDYREPRRVSDTSLRYGEVPPAPSVNNPQSTNLENARRVQNLLTSLGNVASIAADQSAPAISPPRPGYSPQRGQPPFPPSQPYAPPPPTSQAYPPPPSAQAYPPPRPYSSLPPSYPPPPPVASRPNPSAPSAPAVPPSAYPPPPPGYGAGPAATARLPSVAPPRPPSFSPPHPPAGYGGRPPAATSYPAPPSMPNRSVPRYPPPPPSMPNPTMPPTRPLMSPPPHVNGYSPTAPSLHSGPPPQDPRLAGQHDGYDPARARAGKKDVESLLAMLQSRP